MLLHTHTHVNFHNHIYLDVCGYVNPCESSAVGDEGGEVVPCTTSTSAGQNNNSLLSHNSKSLNFRHIDSCSTWELYIYDGLRIALVERERGGIITGT